MRIQTNASHYYRTSNRSLRVFQIVAWCAVLLALPYYVWWLDRWALEVAFEAYLSWKNILANAAPILTLLLFLASICGRMMFSGIIVSGLVAALYAISKIKFHLLGETVVIQDSHFLSNVGMSTIDLFMPYLGGMTLSRWAGLILGLVVLMAVFLIEGKVFLLPRKTRIFGAVLGLAGVCVIATGAWPVKAVYTDTLVRRTIGFEPFSVLRAGLVGTLMYHHVNQPRIDLGVDQKALSDEFEHLREHHLWPLHVSANHQENSTQGQVKPDIIVMLSEAFMDPHVISGMQTLPDVIPNFRRISQQSIAGHIHVPAYGGGTVRTEFEVLTGIPMALFPQVQYPYPELPINKIPGLVSVLSEQGYHTFALHAHPWRFWNRSSAYPRMGMADMKPNDLFIQHGHRDGIWFSDESMTDLLIEQLQEENKPVLALVISLQAHGPYVKDGLQHPDSYDALELPALSQEADEELRLYFYHIHAADRQLGRLVDALESRGRPWRLLFFGDHLPALPTAWSELEFSDGRRAETQKVPWLIAGGGTHMPHTIKYSWQLPAALLENAGLMQPTGYFAFSSAISKRGRDAIGEQESRDAEPTPALRAAAHANLTGTWKHHVQE